MPTRRSQCRRRWGRFDAGWKLAGRSKALWNCDLMEGYLSAGEGKSVVRVLESNQSPSKFNGL